MKTCEHCGHIFDETSWQNFVFPYGFKSVKQVNIKLHFCGNCENILFVEGETIGELCQ